MPRFPQKTQRNNEIWNDKLTGMKHKDMAVKYGISKNRVHEILVLMGFNFYDWDRNERR